MLRRTRSLDSNSRIEAKKQDDWWFHEEPSLDIGELFMTEWREELKAYTTDKKELELLENGPKSLAQSWHMNALHQRWKRIKGIKE